MKTLLLAIALISGLPLAAQVPCNIAGSFTATGDSIIIDNTRLGCYQWRVAYTSTGFSGISISLQTATTFGGSFSDFTGATVVTDGSNPSTATTHAIIGIHSNGAFIKIHLGTATGTGTVVYQVWGANSTSNVATLSGSGSGVTSVTATAPLTSSGGTTPNISASYQGNGAKIQASTGTTTTGDCVQYDANGNTIDSGSPCGSGGGGGPGVIASIYTDTAETTGSNTFVDLTTPDSVTFSCSATCSFTVVYLSTSNDNATTVVGCLNSVFLDGTQVDDGAQGVVFTFTGFNYTLANTAAYKATSISSGSHTVDILHRSENSPTTCTWRDRLLQVSLSN